MRQKILIVDDEPDLVATCVRLLAPRGYLCLRAHTAREAVVLIDAERPDLVLADFHLPDLDGLNVLTHARAMTPPVPGILMTADGSARTVQRAYDTGGISYLPKPFSASRLIEAVDLALR